MTKLFYLLLAATAGALTAAGYAPIPSMAFAAAATAKP